MSKRIRFARRRSSSRKDYKKSRNTRKNQWLRKKTTCQTSPIRPLDSHPRTPSGSPLKIYLHRNGLTYGPYSEDSARGFLEEGRASAHDWAWTPGQDEWIPLGELLTDGPENPSENSWLTEALEKIEGNEKKYEIIEWACEQCGLKPLEVDAKRMYVTDDSGERHLCAHPLEYVVVEKHLGPNIPDRILRERTGYREDHFCPACFEISLLDQEKDSMVCPKCGKEGMKRGIEFANQNCPRCRKGTIVGQPMDTGSIDEIIRSAQAKEQEDEGWN